MRRLKEIYDETEIIDDDNLFCLHLNQEPFTVEEAMKKDEWRAAMNEEIRAIEKNKT